MKCSPIDIGAKSRDRGSTFASRGEGLARTGELKRTPPKRRRAYPISAASTVQRKKAAAGRFCVACGRERSPYLALDPAHLTPRSKGGCDSSRCVVLLCRDSIGGGCHRDFDAGRLDLLAVLTRHHETYLEELQHMLEHLGPVEMVEQLANARVEWREQAA